MSAYIYTMSASEIQNHVMLGLKIQTCKTRMHYFPLPVIGRMFWDRPVLLIGFQEVPQRRWRRLACGQLLDDSLDLICLGRRRVAQGPHPNAGASLWQEKIPGVRLYILETIAEVLETSAYSVDLWFLILDPL